MRNDSQGHYGEVRFNMNKIPCIDLSNDAEFSSEIILYGNATKTFGKWGEAI